MFGRNKVNQIIADLDQFIDKMDECVLLYKNGIRNYLEGNSQAFTDNIQAVMTIRENTTDLRRSIENSLYSYTLVSENRVDILQLLEHMDMIVGQLYKNLVQYEIEIPFFPSERGIPETGGAGLAVCRDYRTSHQGQLPLASAAAGKDSPHLLLREGGRQAGSGHQAEGVP